MSLFNGLHQFYYGGGANRSSGQMALKACESFAALKLGSIFLLISPYAGCGGFLDLPRGVGILNKLLVQGIKW